MTRTAHIVPDPVARASASTEAADQGPIQKNNFGLSYSLNKFIFDSVAMCKVLIFWPLSGDINFKSKLKPFFKLNLKP